MGLTRTRWGLHLWWRVPWEVAKKIRDGIFRGGYFDVIQKGLFLGIFAGVLVKGMGSKGRGFNWGNSNVLGCLVE